MAKMTEALRVVFHYFSLNIYYFQKNGKIVFIRRVSSAPRLKNTQNKPKPLQKQLHSKCLESASKRKIKSKKKSNHWLPPGILPMLVPAEFGPRSSSFFV